MRSIAHNTIERTFPLTQDTENDFQDTSTVLPFVASHGIAWSIIEKKLEEHLIGTLSDR